MTSMKTIMTCTHRYNGLIDADTQQQMAAAQQLLCAGHRQRYAASSEAR